MKDCMLGLIFFILFIPSSFADVQVYKCTKDGLTSFSQTPCKGLENKPLDVKTYTPNKEDFNRAIREDHRRHKEYDKLVKIREKEEAQFDALRRAEAKKQEAKQKQCSNLKIRSEWAREDYRNAKPKGQEQARIKLRRSEQIYAMNCH